jgi:C4-dicarboxylate-specific signal transduction histidine kinase
LRITYNATVVQQLTTQALHASPGARVVLLDEHHIRLADSAQPDLIFTSVAPIATDLIRRLWAEWRLPEGGPVEATGPSALASALKQLANGGYFTAPLSMGSQDAQADPYAVGVARLRYRPWLVVVAEPQAVLLVPIDRLLGEGVILAIAIAFLVSLFGVVTAGWLTSPFRTLTEAVSRFSAGERGVAVAVRSPDEAGELARAFNDMMWRIRAHTAELELQVTERTQALQADIARREAAERALAQTHAELELRVEQRTGELRAAHARLQEELAERERAESEKARLEAQLRQAQKLEAIGTLAGGIAHDFNNILGAILGYAEMALDAAPAGSNLQRYLGNVMAAANRAKDLVDQILAFTQPGSREHVPVRLGPLLGEVAELIKASLPETIELKLRVNAEDATVQGDVIRLHQLVMNVCTNAVQAKAGCWRWPST